MMRSFKKMAAFVVKSIVTTAFFAACASSFSLWAEEQRSAGGDKIEALLTEGEYSGMRSGLKGWTDAAGVRELGAKPLTEEDVKAVYGEFSAALVDPPIPGSKAPYELSNAQDALAKAEAAGKKAQNIFLALSGPDSQRYSSLLGFMRETLYLEWYFIGKYIAGDTSVYGRWYQLHNAGVKETEREYIRVAISAWGIETNEGEDSSPDGYGTAVLPDGSTYEGNFENGLFNGQGKRTWSDGRKYEGDYKDGIADGNGVETWSDGTRYEGAFKEGRWSGKGVVTWKDGRRYEVENP